MNAVRGALLLDVPAADPGVGLLRSALDPAATLGVPAHITALFPFVTEGAGDAVAAVAAGAAPIELTLSRTAWFDDDDVVLWLAPDDPAPFRRLTTALTTAFPAWPPYEGRFDDVVPHLTVGVVGPGVGVPDLRRAEVTARAALPVSTRINQLSWWIGSDQPGSWRRIATFALTGPPAR